MKNKLFLIVFLLVFITTNSFAENEKDILTRNLNNLAEVMTNVASQLELQDQGQLNLIDDIATINNEITNLSVDTSTNSTGIDGNANNITVLNAKVNEIIAALTSLDGAADLTAWQAGFTPIEPIS